MKLQLHRYLIALGALAIFTSLSSLHCTETIIASDYLLEMKALVAQDKLGKEQFIQLSNQLLKRLEQDNFDDLADNPSSIDLVANAGVSLISSPYFAESGAPELQAKGVAAIAMLLRAIDRSIDESWRFPLPKANVSPPLGTTNAAAGMDPATIQNEVLREQYEQAIKENNAINMKNKVQRRLRVQREAIIRCIAGLNGKGNWNKDKILGHFSKNERDVELFNALLE